MTKKFCKTIFSWIMIASLLVTSFLPGIKFVDLVPPVNAAGGVSPDYLSEMEGMDIMMTSASSTYAIGKMDIFDSTSGYLSSLTVTLKDVEESTGFDPSVDLATLSGGATTSGMSLWKDNGDGQFNASLDLLAGALSSNWTSVGGAWQATFSGINWSYSANTNMKIFIAFRASEISTSSPKGFQTIIENGDMTFTGGSIGAWPNFNHYFPPVWIGEAGAGGFGSPFVISEVQTAGNQPTDEFVEIYNRTPMAMDLGGWSLKYSPKTDVGTLSWSTTLYSFSTSTMVQPGGFYLAGYGDLSTTTDATTTPGMNETGGFVGLFNPIGEVMDWVGYGTLSDNTLAEGGQPTYAPTATGSIERKAFRDSTYSMMNTGGIDSMMGNGEDSNNNLMDFIMRTVSEPQNSNSAPELPQGGAGGGGSNIVINEVFYKTATSSQWIELFNRSDGNVNLSNMYISYKSLKYQFPGSMSDLGPGGFLLVKWNKGVAGNTGFENGYNYIETGIMGASLSTYGGDILLQYSDNGIADYVEYGGSGYYNEANAVSNQQWSAGDYVGHSLYGESIGRKSTDGEDWNGSSDWQTFTSPSPGLPNMGGDSTAPTTVTGVALVDNDNTPSSGLNGNDLTITWTPSTIEDPSFARYEIFLLPLGTQINFSTHKPIDNIYSGQYQYVSGSPLSTFTYTGGTFITKDSAGVLLTGGSYIAYVLAFDYYGNKSGTAQSAAATLTEEAYDAGDDFNHPFIMHMGVWSAYTGQDINLIARFNDDRELDATNPAQVIWKAGSSASVPDLTSGTTVTDCVYMNSGFYNCIIPWNGGWNTDTVIGYYLKAKDAATVPNYAYISSSPDADMSYNEANVKQYPFLIDIMAAPADDGDSAWDILGSTYAWDGNIIASATVFLEGMALAPMTSNASGTFSFLDDSIDNGMYNVVVFKDGYMDMSKMVYKGQYVVFYLNEGDMNMSGSSLDSGGNPVVMWTAPFDNMMGAPINIYCSGDCSTIGQSETPIIIAFDRPMNASTINDQNAGDSTSNIYLTTDGNTRVSGKVYYNSFNKEARFYSTTPNSLALGTYYSIIVTQGVKDEAGNPIMGFNSDGSYSSGFNTIMSTSTDFINFGTGGATMPPYIVGVTPAPGSFNVSRNTSVILKFSEPMDLSTINSTNIKLVPITNTSTWTEGAPVAATISLDQITKQIATIDPSADLNASYDWWVVKVMGNVRSSMGMYMADPYSVGGCADFSVCSELNAVTSYQSKFQINTGVIDTVKPSIIGTYPKNNDGITSSTSAVYVGIGALEMGFSEPMDPNTINSQNIKLLSGTSLTSGKVDYDPMSNNAKFIPYSALLANTQYTLRITTDCKDLAGNKLNATSSVYFKTGTSDTNPPSVMYANGDDYSMAITFSEPMNAANQTDTTKWSSSVLNPDNYAVNGFTPQACANPGSWSCGVNLISPYNTVGGTSLSGLGLSFSYEEYNNTVIIKGFQFGDIATDFQVFVDRVKDKSNNVIADSTNRSGDASHLNAARAPLYSSTDTYGALVPGAVNYTMDMGDMGMMMAGAFPMNAMAGQNSIYFVDVPITKSIPIGGKIILTFPAGFDVSGAVKDPYSPVNNDINEWNTGKVTIHSVTGNQSARTITIVATTSATQVTDYLHMDIKGIINSNIPKDFGTEGYMVDIKTFTVDNALLETIRTMPFFISAGGTQTISGNIHGVEAGHNGTMTVFLGSPMTGHMETTVTVTGTGDASADGTYSFNNLPNGEYFIFTEPNVNIGGNNYFGNPAPEPIWISGSGGTKNINLTSESSGGAAVTVHLTGNFTTDGVADNVDVFAGSPNGFRVKTLSGLGNVTNATTTLYLSEGDWMIGIGPAMPEGPMDGPPPMPDWMPPMNSYYHSDGSTPGDMTFSIAGQSAYTVSGTVVDGSNNGIADAEVYAYQPMGGFGGSHTKTATDGTFVLKIPVTGPYMLGAFKPGLPQPKEKAIEVTGNMTGQTIKILKPSYTISGKVLNSAGNAVPHAPVWTWQENSWGHADTMTDSAGNYILYVNPGTWHVEADAPGIGWMEYALGVTITNSSVSNINISPSNNITFYTISGIVGVDTNGDYTNVETPFANMPIRAVKYDANGVYLGKEFNSTTNSNGAYTITVPAGIYRVDIWTQVYGELGVNDQDNDATLKEPLDDDKYPNNPANVNATSANVTGADIIVVQTGLKTMYVTVTNAPSNQEGFLNIEGVDFSGNFPKPNGFHMSRRITDLTATTTIQLAAGDYFVFLDVPGYGGYAPNQSDRDPVKDDIVISATTTVHFTMPNLSSGVVTVSGTVYSGSASGGNELGDAWVWIGNPSNGYHNGTMTASNGTYSIIVPAGTGYKIGADKPGYMSNEPTDLDVSSNVSNRNVVLTANSKTISGYIYADAAGGTSNQYDAGEGIPNGFVRAETTKCTDSSAAGTCVKAHAPVDGSGYYQLGVVDGIWKVYGMANGYSETYYGSTITISGSSATNKHIKLSTDAAWTTKTKKKPITPSSGGSIDDTDSSGTGVKLTIPPNALGSSNSSGNVNVQKTSAVTETNSSDPVGGAGVNVTATDNSGQAITNLDDYVDIEMVLYKSDVDSAISSGELTYDKLKNTKNGYWDSTTNDWVNLATTRKAYYATSSTGSWILYSNTATTTTAFRAFINEIASGSLVPYDYKLTFTSKTNHFTIFAVIMPFVAAIVTPTPDPEPDPTPPPSGGGGGGTYISYCTTVEYGEWGGCADGYQYREVISKNPTSCRLSTTQEADKQRVCQIIETEKSEEITVDAVVTAIPTLISQSTIDVLYMQQGGFIKRGEINEILEIMGMERDHKAEFASRGTLINRLGINLGSLGPSHQYALTNFIAYGSPDTKIGWGERAGVLNSFMSAFGKVPEEDGDWSDVIKIANGRWPTQRSEAAEEKAKNEFMKIYLREPDRSNPHDDAALTVIAYGLRPANRNMESEAAAIRIFKAIYKYNPSAATDWDIVRAIAYSGATR